MNHGTHYRKLLTVLTTIITDLRWSGTPIVQFEPLGLFRVRIVTSAVWKIFHAQKKISFVSIFLETHELSFAISMSFKKTEFSVDCRLRSSDSNKKTGNCSVQRKRSAWFRSLQELSPNFTDRHDKVKYFAAVLFLYGTTPRLTHYSIILT
jgi:hypothetical protein